MKRIKDYTLGEAREICLARQNCKDCVFSLDVYFLNCRLGFNRSPAQFDLTERQHFTSHEIAQADALMRLFGYHGDAKIWRYNNYLSVEDDSDEFVPDRLLENNAFPSIAVGESYTLNEIISSGKEDKDHD